MYAAEVSGIFLALASLVLTGIDAHRVSTSSNGANFMPNFNTEVSSKINPVNDARENDYPFVVYITNDDGDYFCDGALIARRWVLTVGDCLAEFGEDITRVVVGEYVRGTNGTDNEQSIDIAENIYYPGYDADYWYLDNIALIRLARPARIRSEAVSTIEMLKSERLRETFLANEKPCKALGWGKTLVDKVWLYPTKLQQLNIRFWNDSETAERNYELTPNALNIEALYEDEDCRVGAVCNDIGGPVVCRKGGAWVLVGLFSFGWDDDGCMTGIQGATDVLKYTTWIESTIDV